MNQLWFVDTFSLAKFCIVQTLFNKLSHNYSTNFCRIWAVCIVIRRNCRYFLVHELSRHATSNTAMKENFANDIVDLKLFLTADDGEKRQDDLSVGFRTRYYPLTTSIPLYYRRSNDNEEVRRTVSDNFINRRFSYSWQLLDIFRE